jgi:hypothetical protein
MCCARALFRRTQASYYRRRSKTCQRLRLPRWSLHSSSLVPSMGGVDREGATVGGEFLGWGLAAEGRETHGGGDDEVRRVLVRL